MVIWRRPGWHRVRRAGIKQCGYCRLHSWEVCEHSVSLKEFQHWDLPVCLLLLQGSLLGCFGQGAAGSYQPQKCSLEEGFPALFPGRNAPWKWISIHQLLMDMSKAPAQLFSCCQHHLAALPVGNPPPCSNPGIKDPQSQVLL